MHALSPLGGSPEKGVAGSQEYPIVLKHDAPSELSGQRVQSLIGDPTPGDDRRDGKAEVDPLAQGSSTIENQMEAVHQRNSMQPKEPTDPTVISGDGTVGQG